MSKEKEYENDWHESYCLIKDELELLKLKLRKEFNSFTVLCPECKGTGEVYDIPLGAPDWGCYRKCKDCRGSGVKKGLSFDFSNKVLVEITPDEADLMMRDMDGLRGACENDKLQKLYTKVINQIEKQVECRKK